MNSEFKQEVETLIDTRINKSEGQHSVVFYGSSSFRLWDTLSEDIPEINSTNIAFGGSTIKDCIEYYDVLLGQLSPSQILFYAGDNDIANGASVDVVLDRFDLLLKKIRKDFPSTPFTFLSIKPSPIRMEYLHTIQIVNKKIQERIQDQPFCSYLDIHTAMMDGHQVRKELFSEDELHMNASGYAIWNTIVRSFLNLQN